MKRYLIAVTFLGISLLSFAQISFERYRIEPPKQVISVLDSIFPGTKIISCDSIQYNSVKVVHQLDSIELISTFDVDDLYYENTVQEVEQHNLPCTIYKYRKKWLDQMSLSESLGVELEKEKFVFVMEVEGLVYYQHQVWRIDNSLDEFGIPRGRYYHTTTNILPDGRILRVRN